VIDAPGERTESGTPTGCAAALARSGATPNQLIAAYGIEALHAQGFTGQGIRMALVEDGGYTPSDITTFTSCYGITAVTPTFVPTGSLTAQLPVNDEATLDIEVTLSIAPQLAALYVFESSYDTLADYVELYGAPLDLVNTDGAPIDVLSSSLGACEASLTASYVDLMEHLFAVAAAANMSVFASAGDSGSSTCYHHDQTNQALSASYPATSAYVTGVGGTNLALDASNAITGSSVWNDLPWNGKDAAGGGGPSVFVTAPAWQSGTGTGDLMRTTPDVAFFADPAPGYTIFNSSNGGWYDDGGTSAATPFFAASTALLHQAMLAQRGTTPVVAYEWISGIAASSANDVFYDIVLGDNDLFDVGCCTAGPGYDQASGWGSLNVGAVSAVLNGATQYQIEP
jgi:kumamolisin